MILSANTFDRLKISPAPSGYASPLAAALILAAAFGIKLLEQVFSPTVVSLGDWACLAGLLAAITLNLRDAWHRGRRRNWALILDRKAGRITFIRVRPVRVQPKTVPLADIQALELGRKDPKEAEFRYQPRFRLVDGRVWHVPDLWGNRAHIEETVEAVNSWLNAAKNEDNTPQQPPQTAPETPAPAPAKEEDANAAVKVAV